MVSVIHERMLEYCDYEPTGTRTKEYLGAGGHALDLLPHVVDVSVEVKNIGMVVFRKVLVLKRDSKVTRTLLVGRSDLSRLKATIDFAKKEVCLGTGEMRRSIKMKDKPSRAVRTVEKSDRDRMREIEVKMDRIFEGFDINAVKIKGKKGTRGGKQSREPKQSREDPDGLQQSHNVDTDGMSTEAVCGEPCMYTEAWCGGCEHCVDKKFTEWAKANEKAPDIEGKEGREVGVCLNKYIERLRQKSRATYTHKECTVDKEFAKDHPKAAKRIHELIEEYKDVFSADIGKVSDQYAANADITGKMSPLRPGHQQFQGTTLLAILKQFAKQIADGVLVDVQKAGIIPKNYLQVLPIKKKDDDGKVLDVLSSLRVVVDSTPVNGHTDYIGLLTDNLNDSISFAARTSRKGFNIKADIGDAFYAIPLHKSKWCYFCITIPFLGTYCYTRIVQGWGPSAQICQEVFARIFFELKEFMRRYMDDLVIATMGTEDEYIQLVEKFFRIVRLNNLRLKGKKCFFGARAFNFLGVKIVNGQITPSPHFMEKLEKMAHTNILTKTQMRSFVMSFAFLARFLKRSSELLKPLRDVMNGNGKDRITWTDELTSAYYRVQKALQELVRLYPFEPELQTVMVVDTSKEATGGFIYQVHKDGPRLISFFSRTRKDKERKITLSSCHIELLGLKVMTLAFIPLLRQAKKTIIAVTDNAPTVQIWNKFRKHELPSHDTRINNALYMIASSIDLNIVHAKNTNEKLQFADMLSRLKIIRESKPCEGTPKCPICKAADIDDMEAPAIISAVEEMTDIEKNIPDILYSHKVDGINLVPDEWAFEPWRFRENNSINAVIMDRPWTMRELLESPRELRAMQSDSKDLRAIRKGLEVGRKSYPKKLQRLQTMLESRNARLEEGVVYLDKTTGGVTRKVIPIPDCHAMKVVAAVHRTVGHGPVTQTVQQVQRYFEVAKPKEKVEKLIKQCIKCALLKGGANYKRQQKAVPTPSDMFRSVLADEITRNIRGTPVKMLIAMEAMSQFMMVVVYEGAMNGEKFIAAMGYVKSVLCPHSMDNLKIELRCDQASWHTGALVQQGLAAMGINLRVHSSTTLSKNVIPELDVKIKNYSRQLIQEIQDTAQSLGLGLPCHLAAAKVNNTIGSSGYTPAELFVGRGWKNNETIQLNVKEILEKVIARRKKRREYEDRKRLKGQRRKELKLVPYDDPTLNSDLVNNPDLVAIKEGDMVTLKVDFNKNEPKAPYVVKKVDFRKRQALLRRESGLDTAVIGAKWICFSRIQDVFPKEDRFLLNMVASLEFDSDEEEEREKERALGHSGKFKNFMLRAAGQIINMYGAPSTEVLDSMEEGNLGISEENVNSRNLLTGPMPIWRSRPPGGVILTSDGPKMEGTPSDQWRWPTEGVNPGTGRSYVGLENSPRISADSISTSSFEDVTQESLEQCKKEHPASALHKLTVLKRTPEVKPEVKPKPNPFSRKLEIKSRLKDKISRRKTESEIKIEPEVKPEVKNFKPVVKLTPKSGRKEGNSPRVSKSGSKTTPKNVSSRIDTGLHRPRSPVMKKEPLDSKIDKNSRKLKKKGPVDRLRDEEIGEKERRKEAKNLARRHQIDIDESPVRSSIGERPKSTRKAAKAGQKTGAFRGYCK